MGVIYLIRHGQARTDAYGRIGDPNSVGPLTDIGRSQAQATGRVLAVRLPSVDAAFSGDLLRHRETMECLRRQIGFTTEVSVTPEWNEYDLDSILGGGGIATRMAGRELQKLVDSGLDNWVSPSGTPLDGESYAAFEARCRHALRDAVAAAGSGKTVLVVASAGSISQVCAHVLGLSAHDWVRFSRTMINTSISKLSVGRSGTSLMAFNEHSHLDNVTHDGSALLTFR